MSIEDLKIEIKSLQDELAIAYEGGESVEAYDLEKKIDELQAQLFRQKSAE